MKKQYRQNVAIIVLNNEGSILACQRSDQYRSWQFPQGGIDDGESREHTMRRELLEEIGTAEVELIGSLPESIRYEWTIEHIPGYHGQEQWYYLVRLRTDAKIDLRAHAPHEFQDYRWVSVEEFLKLSIGFKEEAYRQAIRFFQVLHPGILREK